MQSQVKRTIRSNYSNPPAHGAALVTTVLADSTLRSQWEGEVAGMRNRINGMRQALVLNPVQPGNGKVFVPTNIHKNN